MIEHTRGKIISGGGDVLAEGVDVWIEKVQRGKLYDWHGGLALPEGLSIGVGGPYRLELDDGRSGEILVTNISSTSLAAGRMTRIRRFSGSAKTEALFQGSGPLE